MRFEKDIYKQWIDTLAECIKQTWSEDKTQKLKKYENYRRKNVKNVKNFFKTHMKIELRHLQNAQRKMTKMKREKIYIYRNTTNIKIDMKN